jgi:outer membrane protein
MKKTSLLFLALISFSLNAMGATTLVQVYEQAVESDPVYQQAIAQRYATGEGVPISRSALFPQASILGGPLINKNHVSGLPGQSAFSSTSRGYSVTLSVSQTVFNYAAFKSLSGAEDTSKQANAALNAATQSLMLRVAEAYFAVLKDEETLLYNGANKKSFSKQLDQISQQFKFGLKTQTDVFTSRAAYDSANAQYIAAQTTLMDDQENLRAITGVLYPNLATLNEDFPLISPQPANMNAWVETAERQNWSIKSAEFANLAAMENIKQQRAGHFPTVSVDGSYNVAYSNTLGPSANNGGVVTDADDSGNVGLLPGATHSSDKSVALNLGIPIFSGGLVVAQTNQAKFNYQVTSQQLEQTVRSSVNTTRQSYMGIMSGIRQIQADRQAIRSTISSLDGLREGYRVGTQTLVSVLNQQQQVFRAQTQYAADRYAYVINLLTLKQAAGTLSEDDLQAINAWLNDAASASVDHGDEDDSRATDTYLYRYDTLKPKALKQHSVVKPKVNSGLRNETASLKHNIMLAKLDSGRDLSLSP